MLQENKELKEVLEKVSKDLGNIAYDQIPIEMQRAFGKEYNLGYRLGWYNTEEDWKSKVKGKIEEAEEYEKKVKTIITVNGTYYIPSSAYYKILQEGYRELLEEGE